MTRRYRGRVKVAVPVKVRTMEPVPESPRIRIDPELQRLIFNWLLWRNGGGAIGMGASATYSVLAGLLGHDARETNPPPVLAADAERLNRAISSLPGAHRQVLMVWWTGREGLKAKAKRARCGVEKLIALVQVAHDRLAEVIRGHVGDLGEPGL